MYVENNVCDSIIGTLLYIKGNKKDGINAGKDLVEIVFAWSYNHDLMVNEHICL